MTGAPCLVSETLDGGEGPPVSFHSRLPSLEPFPTPSPSVLRVGVDLPPSSSGTLSTSRKNKNDLSTHTFQSMQNMGAMDSPEIIPTYKSYLVSKGVSLRQDNRLQTPLPRPDLSRLRPGTRPSQETHEERGTGVSGTDGDNKERKTGGTFESSQYSVRKCPADLNGWSRGVENGKWRTTWMFQRG